MPCLFDKMMIALAIVLVFATSCSSEILGQEFIEIMQAINIAGDRVYASVGEHKDDAENVVYQILAKNLYPRDIGCK